MRKKGFQQVHLIDDVIHGLIDVNPFPIGQHVDRQVIHVVGQLMVLDPDMPRLGRTDGNLQGLARLVQIDGELLQGQILAQQHLVADDGPHDVWVFDGRLQEYLHVGLVLLLIVIDPDAGGDIDTVFSSQLGNFFQNIFYRVGADGIAFPLQQRQVGLEFRFRWVLFLQRTLPALKG